VRVDRTSRFDGKEDLRVSCILKDTRWGERERERERNRGARFTCERRANEVCNRRVNEEPVITDATRGTTHGFHGGGRPPAMPEED